MCSASMAFLMLRTFLSHLGSIPVFQELAHCQPDTVPGFTLCKALCFVFPYVSLYQSEYIR